MKTKNPFSNSDSNKRYYSYDYFLRRTFGRKCAKIPIDAGFTCPNIDGTKGYGGCIFCSGRGSGDFCASPSFSVEEQYEKMRAVMSEKWGETGYIPYFQAHTNTYAPLEVLKEKYESALSLPGVVGLSIATRPDALPEDVVSYLRELSGRTFLTVELGLQTIHDETAKKMNFCRTYQDFIEGYEKLEGLNICIHIINGLPGESREMMLRTAGEVAHLHPGFVKIHLLHVLAGTKLAEMYKRGEFQTLTREEYVEIVVSQLEALPSDIVIGRITGDGAANSLIAPLWSLKKLVVMNEVDKEFVRRNLWQGKNIK